MGDDGLEGTYNLDDTATLYDNGGFVTFPFSNNELSVSIGPVCTQAIIDSGADLNVISFEFLNTLPVHFKNKFKPKTSEIYCANGSTATVLGEVSLPVDIANKKVSVKFHVMHAGHSNIYFGIPFLKKYSAILTFDSSNQNSISVLLGVSVYSDSHIEIKPYTEAVIMGNLQVPLPSPTEGYCFHTDGIQ